jgi:thioredoxin 1
MQQGRGEMSAAKRGKRISIRALLACAAIGLLSACTSVRHDSNHSIAMTDIAQTNDAKFEHDVIDSDQPVLVEFAADACPPCEKMEPILEDLAMMYKHKVKVVLVDVHKNPRVAQRYRIVAVPRLMLFKNGDLVDDVLGATSRERLSYTLDRTL